MDIPCLVTRAEDNWAERAERRAAELEAAADRLSAEYMAACMLPLIATVGTPGGYVKRSPFLEVWGDSLTNDRQLMARVISILTRSQEGLAVLREMADAHGEWHAGDEVLA